MNEIFVRMQRFFATLAAGAVGMGFGAMALLTGPAIEARHWPVVTGVTYTVTERGRGRMTLEWSGFRGRGHCVFQAASANVLRSGKWVPSVISAAGTGDDEPLRGSTRPEGFQYFTAIDVIPDGDAIVMTLQHRCHPLWVTTTRIPEARLIYPHPAPVAGWARP